MFRRLVWSTLSYTLSLGIHSASGHHCKKLLYILVYTNIILNVIHPVFI